MRRPCSLRPSAALCLLACSTVAGEGCEHWCGQWACPGDFCNDCPFEQCDWQDTAEGTPEGATPAGNFRSPHFRLAPVYTEAGDRVDGSGTTDNVHPVMFDANQGGRPFTPFHLGTNMPHYTPWETANESLAPTLAKAGIVAWRWPGGAATNFWCPTFPGDPWDSCFD
eukprot:6699564-Prymnesium_polylepis.1